MTAVIDGDLSLSDLTVNLTSEPEEPDHDDQPVGGAVLAGLQAAVGPG